MKEDADRTQRKMFSRMFLERSPTLDRSDNPRPILCLLDSEQEKHAEQFPCRVKLKKD